MLSPFWIIGIVLNVALTGLAIWWVLKQSRPPQQEPVPVDKETPPPHA